MQMISVICCSSFEYCQPLGAGAFRGAFTTNVAPQCRAFSRALEIEKLKAPLFRGPEGAGDSNDWCIGPGRKLEHWFAHIISSSFEQR